MRNRSVKKILIVALALCLVLLAGCSRVPKRPTGDGVMLTADCEDWGVVPEPTGYFWTITFDGDAEVFGYGQNSGKSREWTLKETDLDDIWKLLNGEFQKKDKGKEDGTDGAGWRITSYDKNGKQTHEFYGRVDGIKDLEKLSEMLMGFIQ